MDIEFELIDLLSAYAVHMWHSGGPQDPFMISATTYGLIQVRYVGEGSSLEEAIQDLKARIAAEAAED